MYPLWSDGLRLGAVGGEDHVADLGLSSDQVFAIRNRNDGTVRFWGRFAFGPEPTKPSFGATVLPRGPGGHDARDYLGSQYLALVATGRYGS